MSFGIRSESTSGFVQIDQDFVCAHMVAYGSCTSRLAPGWAYYIELPLTGWSVADAYDAVVLARPFDLGKFIGNYYIHAGMTPPTLFLACQGPFEYQIYSTRRTPITDSAAYGIEIFTASGQISYSTERRYPSVFSTSVVSVPVGQVPPNHIVSGGFASQGQIPWVVMNQFSMAAVETPEGGGQAYSTVVRFPTFSTFDAGFGEVYITSTAVFDWTGASFGASTWPLTLNFARP